MRTTLMAMAAMLAFAATASAMPKQGQDEGYNLGYKITVPMGNDLDGHMLYLHNYDTGEKLDSAKVTNGYGHFTGEIDEPAPAAIVANEMKIATFVLEPGAFNIDTYAGNAGGTMLNDILKEYERKGKELAEAYQEASAESQDSILNAYFDLTRATINDNGDNPVGYFALITNAYMFSPEETIAIIDANPMLASYQRVAKAKSSAEKVLATGSGNHFVDYEIEYNGQTKRLSDYAGRGRYTLVDYWASWCGPCRREIALLKELYPQYKDKVDFLGVAVWDDPEDTEAAIKSMGIPWDCIINAQTIPTDLYGIQGIPCIMLIDPQGTIVFRDLQDDELREALKKAIEG